LRVRRRYNSFIYNIEHTSQLLQTPMIYICIFLAFDCDLLVNSEITRSFEIAPRSTSILVATLSSRHRLDSSHYRLSTRLDTSALRSPPSFSSVPLSMSHQHQQGEAPPAVVAGHQDGFVRRTVQGGRPGTLERREEERRSVCAAMHRVRECGLRLWMRSRRMRRTADGALASPRCARSSLVSLHSRMCILA
jgi:hypothetical protein